MWKIILVFLRVLNEMHKEKNVFTVLGVMFLWDILYEEGEEDICDCAQLRGLCGWWPSDRVRAIQISGITMRALYHRQPDWVQLITSQRGKRFAAVCFLFHSLCHF